MTAEGVPMPFDELRSLHSAFEPIVNPEGNREILLTLRDWANGTVSTEEVKEKGMNVERFVNTVLEGSDEVAIARKKLAAKRFASVKLDELDADERSRQCGYFLAIGAGEQSASQRQNTNDEDVVRIDLDVAALHRQLLEQESIAEVPMESIVEVAYRAAEMFSKEKNIVSCAAPCVVVGDIHGQFLDLKNNILKNGGPLESSRYVFLGDYVDRGDESILSVLLLLTAKLMYPDNIFMIRGNHESRQTNCIYGFLTECKNKFPQAQAEGEQQPAYASMLTEHPIWTRFNEVFDALPIAAIVNEKLFCVHGGLSPAAETLEQILAVKRKTDIDEGVLADLTWSDPTSGSGFHFNSRGSGHLFGEDVTAQFLEQNGLSLLCRAHQCVRAGFQYDHNNKLLTVFSAPNYCGQGNDGAILKIESRDADPTIVTFQAVPRENNSTATPGGLPMYFQR